jgi:hypothetical protein
MAADVHCSL